MSTHALIIVKIPEQMAGKTAKFNPALHPKDRPLASPNIDMNDAFQETDLSAVGKVRLTNGYLVTSVHWDGYPNGVGLELLQRYNTPETAVNLALLGDISSLLAHKHLPEGGTDMTVEYVTPYILGKDNKWKDCHPETVSSIHALDTFEFNYLFENGKWKCKSAKMKDWADAKDAYAYAKLNPDDPYLEKFKS